MIPQFEFIRPQNIQETISVLAQYKSDARLIAGGTDIMPGFRQESARFKEIKVMVDIHHLEELKTIEKNQSHLLIGAGVTFSQLAIHPDVNLWFPVLVKAALGVGSVQIRNRATLAGNFVNNAPCADTVPPLLVYEAVIRIASQDKKREMLLADFLLSPYHTQLLPDEMVTHILLPIPAANLRGDFFKLGRRRAVAISRISLALVADIRDGVFHELKLASGAITPIGKRFENIEQLARTKEAKTETYKKLAKELGKEILELTGLRWSTPYKLPVVQQAFYQLLESVCSSVPNQEK